MYYWRRKWRRGSSPSTPTKVLKDQLARQKWRVNFFCILLATQILTWLWVLTNATYWPKPFAFNVAGISWVNEDRTWFSEEATYRQVQLWGNHFFGDLQIFFGMVSDPTPYLDGRGITPQTPAFGLSFYSFLNIWGPHFALKLFFLLTFVFSVLVVRRWLEDEEFSVKVLAYCALIPLNASVLMGLDRGNILLFAIAIVGILVHKVFTDRILTAIDAFIFASIVSLKPFLGLLVIFFIVERRFKFLVQAAVFGLLANILAAFKYGSSLFQMFAALYREQSTAYSGTDGLDFSIRWSASSFRVLYDLVQKFTNPDFAIGFFANYPLFISLPGIIYLFLVVVICYQRKIPMWIRSVSILSTAQMCVAATPRYNLVWSLVGGLLILQQSRHEQKVQQSLIPSREYVIATACSLGFILGGLPFEWVMTYSPYVWCSVTLLILVIFNLPTKRVNELVATNYNKLIL